MNFKEIKEIELQIILASMKRLTMMGFLSEEISEGIYNGVNKIMIDLTQEELYDMEKMRKLRKLEAKEEENEKEV